MRQAKESKKVEVVSVSAVSPHSKALYEIGKTILLDTISTGREFCKTMIGTSTSAVPIYIGILTFLLPEDFVLGVAAGITIVVPAFGFLIASILFTLGYLPVSGKFSLDDIDEIDATMDRIIIYRRRFIWSGLTIFIVSSFLAISSVVVNIGVK